MLHYLNGVGAVRRNRKKPSAKSILSRVKPKTAQKILSRVAKTSPLTAIKMQKQYVAEKIRQAHINKGEPFLLSKLPSIRSRQNIDDLADAYLTEGIEEADSQEFDTQYSPDSESGGSDLGIIYPDEPYDLGIINGKRGRARRDEKRALKSEKKKSKVSLRLSKAEAKKLKAEGKRLRGEGKRLKGEGGGSDAKDIFNQGLDTVNNIFGKGNQGGGGGADADSPGGGSGSGSGGGSEPSFFEKNKTMLLVGGGIAILGLGYLATRKK